jgi:hypothetical protein
MRRLEAGPPGKAGRRQLRQPPGLSPPPARAEGTGGGCGGRATGATRTPKEHGGPSRGIPGSPDGRATGDGSEVA